MMKTIDEIMDFHPQITALEFGGEPSLREVLWESYKGSDFTKQESVEIVEKYIQALKEFVGEKE